MGLLVARNVVKAPGRVDPETLLPKTNASEFARRSKTSVARVLRYLEGWERAADAGSVPHAAELLPGQEVLALNGQAFTLDADVLPSWRTFYNVPKPAQVPRLDPNLQRIERPLDEAPRRTVRLHPVELTAEMESRDQQRIDAMVDRAGAQYRQERERGMSGMHFDRYEGEAGGVARAHSVRATEVKEVLAALGHYTQRLSALSLDPEWQEQGRDAAADKARLIAAKLVKVADYIHNDGTVTDAEVRELMNSDG